MSRSTRVPELLAMSDVSLPTSRHTATSVSGVLTKLRQLAPQRALDDHETVVLAERQAGLLLDLAGLQQPPTPSALITELPRVLVTLRADLPVSGATQWAGQHWLLMINKDEPVQRQRFSLAHEYKHCVDHRQHQVLYRGTDTCGPRRQAELAADAFAAALLMPESWLRAAYDGGLTDVFLLARRFQVSEPAMRRRLEYFGLAVNHSLLEVA